jgi:hypothetical protein
MIKGWLLVLGGERLLVVEAVCMNSHFAEMQIYLEQYPENHNSRSGSHQRSRLPGIEEAQDGLHVQARDSRYGG